MDCKIINVVFLYKTSTTVCFKSFEMNEMKCNLIGYASPVIFTGKGKFT